MQTKLEDPAPQPAPKRILLSWSGGKDSAWALHLLRQQPQYEVVALLTTINEKFRRVAIHGYREELLDQQAEAAGLPLWKVDLPFPCSNADFESRMATVCARAVAEGLHGIAFGDLFLEDIRAYRIAMLAGTGLEPIFPVWTPDLGISTAELARQMIAAGLRAHLTCIDPRALSPSFAGRTFDADLLADLPVEVDPCGERGEFHTFAFAGPMFSRTVPVVPAQTVERDNFVYAELLPAENPPAPHPRKPLPAAISSVVCVLIAALAVLFSPTSALAQTLAHPGLVGNGLHIDHWWQHAIFYRIATSTGPTDFKAISARLDSLHSLGVDALLLPAPALPPPGTNGSMPNLDDLDDLLRQASGHDMRVLLTLQPSSGTQDLSGIARFWLSRGVAGLHIATSPETSPEDTQAMVQKVRKLASSVAGQRIVISEVDLAPPTTAQTARQPSRQATSGRASRGSESSVAQLQIDSRPDRAQNLDAASIRPLLAQTIAQPNLLLDLHAPSSSATLPSVRPPLAKAVATISLITHPDALIDSRANLVIEPTSIQSEAPDPPTNSTPPTPAALPPGTYLPYVPYSPPPRPRPAAPKPVTIDPLTTWYRKLAAIHHDNPVIRSGSKIFLDFDAQNTLVWVNRPASPSPSTPPVVVACNLSASPVQLSLAAPMKELNLHGFFLRTLLRSDDAMGAQDLNSVTLPPFGVYIGELRR